MGLFWSHPESGWRLGRRCCRHLHTQLFMLKNTGPFREMIGLFGGNMGLFWSHPDSGWRLGRRCRRYLHTQLFILKNAGLFWEMIGLFGGNTGLFWSHLESGWRLGRRCHRYLHTQLFILKNAGLFWEMIGLFFMEYRALLITSGKRITTWETLPSRSSYSAMNSRSRPLNTCFITASIVESSGLVCLFAYSMCVCILYVCCSVLQCVAVCYSVLQCVAVCWVYLRIQCVCVYCIYVCM